MVTALDRQITKQTKIIREEEKKRYLLILFVPPNFQNSKSSTKGIIANVILS